MGRFAPLWLLLSVACASPPLEPGDPLTGPEIESVATALRQGGLLDNETSVVQMSVQEPPKSGAVPPDSVMRHAEAELLAHRSGLVTRAVIRLGETPSLVSVDTVAGARPRITRRDIALALSLVRQHPAWRDAVAARNLTERDVVPVVGGPGPVDETDHRLLRVQLGHREAASPFLAPVEGLVALVDLTSRTVIEVLDDREAGPPRATVPFTFRGAAQATDFSVGALPRHYTIDGHRVRWDGWEFSFGMDPREGVVLRQVRFGAGSSAPRQVLARASLSEMLVPYGDPSPAWRFRRIYDAGEFGLGATATSLVPGHDVPSGATLLDAVLADEDGRPRRFRRVIGIHERDGGLRWRHAARAVRSRELVVRSVATLGNYDYGISWVFSPDGVLAVEIDLTGVMQVQANQNASTPHGSRVDEYHVAVHHQHFFGFRFDFDIDGPANRIAEGELTPLPMRPGNPTGTGFSWSWRPLASERLAVREAAPGRSRQWRITSAHSDVPSGYVIGSAGLPDFATAFGTRARDDAAFAGHQLFVTRHDPRERYPAGDYPGQGGGVASYRSDDAALDGEDLVVWYTVGMTHIPRPEEWPLMPVSRLRFELRPVNFAIDGPWH